MKKLLLITLSFSVWAGFAQKKKQQDIEAINAMCGCYEVTFNFAETFSPNKEYEFHENYKAGGLELVLPVEESKNKIVLQHLLIVGDTMIIKHWRQDWVYENTALYHFDKENTWKFVEKPDEEIKGQWTQKVYQVDDGPRYEGSASWVHVDGRHYWENTTDAPLPRREFSKRSDYNVMARTNRHEITEYGWLHEQDNDKVLREGGKDQLIASEKGLNTYKKTSDDQCAVAVKWWEEHQYYWADVRAVWDQLFAMEKTVSIKKKVDDKVLFQKLFALEDELTGPEYASEEARKKIKEIINSYLENDLKLALN